MTLLLSTLFVASNAAANYDWGACYIYCSSGTTAGPYWSTAESCCDDFQALCGGNGTAYTDYPGGTYSEPNRAYCLSF